MAVDGVGSSTSTSTQQNSTSTTTSSKASALGYDAFLKLLTAQMQYQDPTKPMDSTQFVSQLASFSAVEQQTKTNTKLDSILTSLSISQAGLVGHTVSSDDGATTGVVKEVRVTSDGATATLTNGKTLDLSAGIRITS